MPRRDGTGPAGNGPRSGRGMGFCDESKGSNFRNAGCGNGLNKRRRCGRGLGKNNCDNTISTES